MREIIERLAAPASGDGAVSASLTLAFDQRRKSRQRVRLDGGEEAALLLERGTVLRDGDLLRCRDGALVRVRAAPEALSRVPASDGLSLARAAYHLGNRHIPVAVERDGLSYQHDHVLDDMIRGLGLPVQAIVAPFQPEGGAYGGHHQHDHPHLLDHPHHHDHTHDHPHDHDHDH